MIDRSTKRQTVRKKIETVRQQRERNFVGKIIEEARSFKINEIEIFIFGEKKSKFRGWQGGLRKYLLLHFTTMNPKHVCSVFPILTISE